jgi:hypothetical protein
VNDEVDTITRRAMPVLLVCAVTLLGLVGYAIASLWSAPSAVGCRPPEPHEQLHIVVVPRAGKFVAECMYVAPRGAAAAAAREAKR